MGSLARLMAGARRPLGVLPDATLPARVPTSDDPEPEVDAHPTHESAPRDGLAIPLHSSNPIGDPASPSLRPANAPVSAGPRDPAPAVRGWKRKAHPDTRGGARVPSDPSDISQTLDADDADDSRDSRGATDDDVAAASSPPEASALPAPRPKTHDHEPAHGKPKNERRCKVHGCNAVCDPGYFSKNRVCREHTRADAAQLFTSGPLVRFCTRCTTFHHLSAFSAGFRVCASQLRADARRRAAKSGRVSRVASHPGELSLNAVYLETLEGQIQSEVDERRRARFHAGPGTGPEPGLGPGHGPGHGSGHGSGHGLGHGSGHGPEPEPEFPPPAPSRYFRLFAPPIESESVRSRGHHPGIGSRIFSRFTLGQASSGAGLVGALGTAHPSPSWPPPHAPQPQHAGAHPFEEFPSAYERMNPHPHLRAHDDSFFVGSDQHDARQEMQILTAMEPRGEPRAWPEAILAGGHEAPGSREEGEEETCSPPRLSVDSDFLRAFAPSNCIVGFSHGLFHEPKVDRPDGREDASSTFFRRGGDQ